MKQGQNRFNFHATHTITASTHTRKYFQVAKTFSRFLVSLLAYNLFEVFSCKWLKIPTSPSRRWTLFLRTGHEIILNFAWRLANVSCWSWSWKIRSIALPPVTSTLAATSIWGAWQETSQQKYMYNTVCTYVYIVFVHSVPDSEENVDEWSVTYDVVCCLKKCHK